MPIGLARASKAMAIPSNPMAAKVPGWNECVVPAISPAAAIPANPPDSVIASMMIPLTLIPA